MKKILVLFSVFFITNSSWCKLNKKNMVANFDKVAEETFLNPDIDLRRIPNLKQHIQKWNNLFDAKSPDLGWNKEFIQEATNEQLKCFIGLGDKCSFKATIFDINYIINNYLIKPYDQKVQAFKEFYEVHKELKDGLSKISTWPLTYNREVKEYLEYLLGTNSKQGLLEKIFNKISNDFNFTKERQIKFINGFSKEYFFDQSLVAPINDRILIIWTQILKNLTFYANLQLTRVSANSSSAKSLKCIVSEDKEGCSTFLSTIYDINNYIFNAQNKLTKYYDQDLLDQLDLFVLNFKDRIGDLQKVSKLKLNSKPEQDVQDVLLILLLTFEKIIYKIQSDFQGLPSIRDIIERKEKNKIDKSGKEKIEKKVQERKEYIVTYPILIKDIVTISNYVYGISLKDLPEMAGRIPFTSNLKNWDPRNETISNKILRFDVTLNKIKKFVNEADNSQLNCLVAYEEQKCKLDDSNKQLTIFDLANSINNSLKILNGSSIFYPSATFTKKFKEIEQQIKDILSKFNKSLSVVKVDKSSSKEQEAKKALEYLVKIYSKVLVKLKADYKM